LVDTVDDNDDGFSDPPSNRGSDYFRYDEDHGWRDRDGVPPTGVKVAIKIGECAIGWIDERQQVITQKPVDVDALNAAVPAETWRTNKFTGNKEPPYKAGIYVLLVDPETGATHRYVHHTVGARIAYEDLKEATAVMRRLRGENVYPAVTLDERPMKKKGDIWGKRPAFTIVAWKSPGGERGQPLPAPDTPRLAAPAAVAETNAATQTPQPASPLRESRPHPIPAPAIKPPSAKRPISLSGYTKAVMTGAAPGMTDVLPPTTEELLDDSLEELPWDTEPSSRS
jgi:hypothetical protein